MILRPALLADAPALAALGRASFCAAFDGLYSPADLAIFLTQSYATEKVAAEIASDRFLHCLAMDGDMLTGFCKLGLENQYADHSAARNPIILSQLYTAPEMTGAGIGAALMDWAMDVAHQQGRDAIQLSVYSENFGAQRFYQRYGFARIADIHFQVGSQLDEEFLYELPIGQPRS
ncbi:GNAT family N-acetyltransferase [Altererythrobacter confluentis]|uniref:GNAT family N-acetyltransferase n=1 Tax=Allopontixanthobacter confluentis TaxID=1849021 RepID=A0A6L7GHP5_9SPHN|nr:GNAT family N-acetyltransferase [Allopontixanthobacter confluentis]MXP15593.1 GNAT family N-acetyltransferase [Allopontixanthobacter confluentis]